eukprot:491243-Pelagomonas_calceolata.AAC.6
MRKISECRHVNQQACLPVHTPDRFARGVLAREDPAESFLKQLPADADQFEVIYPVSLEFTQTWPCVLKL